MKILVVENRYDSSITPRYYDASTPEKQNKVCLGLLREYRENGVYNYIDSIPDAPSEPERPANLESQPNYVFEAYTAEVKKWREKVKDRLSREEEQNFLAEALADETGKTAYYFIQAHEDVQIEHVLEEY